MNHSYLSLSLSFITELPNLFTSLLTRHPLISYWVALHLPWSSVFLPHARRIFSISLHLSLAPDPHSFPTFSLHWFTFLVCACLSLSHRCLGTSICTHVHTLPATTYSQTHTYMHSGLQRSPCTHTHKHLPTSQRYQIIPKFICIKF